MFGSAPPRMLCLNLCRLLCAMSLALLSSCSASSEGQAPGRNTGGPSTGGKGPDLNLGSAGTLNLCTSANDGAPGSPHCGDGVLDDDEACDDGNRTGDDGCAANCLSVQAGFSCSTPGKPCQHITRCGDGIVGVAETCDDANVVAGDGCSATCKLERGYKCEGNPSVCSHTTCGDGIKEGAESCDDGNVLPFDGCSADCLAEPTCSGGDGCTSRCGDGLVLNEECDDGNSVDGDGCSSSCHVEPGYICAQDTACEKKDGKCVLRVPAIFRDFDVSHPDFEPDTSSCTGSPAHSADSDPARGWATGLVENQLDTEGKPVLAQAVDALKLACISSSKSFHDWYRASALSKTVVGSILLWQNPAGAYVNRYGPNGEQWAKVEGAQNSARTCGNVGLKCAGCAVAANEKCWDPCTPLGDNYSQGCVAGVSYLDGNPLFFPVDPGNDSSATVPPLYWVPNQYTNESRFNPKAGPHNFYFTTEVRYWFRFDSSKVPKLDFTGDDDVWVFVNGMLAVDLGGMHAPVAGSVTLDAAKFQLTTGNVYPIAIFHAERKTMGSSFRLTLDGFETTSSDCHAVCGDGIVASGEQCDDGVNDGGYGECQPGCVLGAYCGDGVKQEGEYCDDGNQLDGDGCSSSCRNVVVR